MSAHRTNMSVNYKLMKKPEVMGIHYLVCAAGKKEKTHMRGRAIVQATGESWKFEAKRQAKSEQ